MEPRVLVLLVPMLTHLNHYHHHYHYCCCYCYLACSPLLLLLPWQQLGT